MAPNLQPVTDETEAEAEGQWSDWYSLPDGGRQRRWTRNVPSSAALAEPSVAATEPSVTHQPLPQTEPSAMPAEPSVTGQPDHQTEPSVTGQPEPLAEPSVIQSRNSEVVDLAEVRARLNLQSSVAYDRKFWKKSRIKKGYLIKRIPGYNIVEDEYSVSYLFVLSRKPDRTSADWAQYPYAGSFRWVTLESAGLLVKERKNATQSRSRV